MGGDLGLVLCGRGTMFIIINDLAIIRVKIKRSGLTQEAKTRLYQNGLASELFLCIWRTFMLNSE